MTAKYKEASENLAKVIDIAIEAFKKHLPKDWDEKTLTHVVNCYLGWKESALNPKPQYCNMQSLKYDIENVFTPFQEGSGEEVNMFWDRIKEENLPYKRENKLAKILKRKRINNDIEYDFVTDVLVPYQQENLITEEDVALLNTLLSDFENRKKK